MTRLRVGTRGSDLALRQTAIVCDALRPLLGELEVVRLRTAGDAEPDRPIDAGWPVGGFVGAIEAALLDGRIDLAVHSLKDLPSAPTPGLTLAATPAREAVHDVLVTASGVDFDRLPSGLRIGTSSPRRAAQLRRHAGLEAVPIRGNVPTRLEKVGDEVDGVVLAAAGLRRLGLTPPHAIDLPLERFLPAPGQGTLVVQRRDDDDRAAAALEAIDHDPTRRAALAERSFLARLGAGCTTAVAALAIVVGDDVELRAEVFPGEGRPAIQGVERGASPEEVGARLADRLAADRSRT